MANRSIQALSARGRATRRKLHTSSKYIFFPSPCAMNQFKSFRTNGHAWSAVR
jgi:hypothetical protein